MRTLLYLEEAAREGEGRKEKEEVSLTSFLDCLSSSSIRFKLTRCLRKAKGRRSAYIYVDKRGERGVLTIFLPTLKVLLRCDLSLLDLSSSRSKSAESERAVSFELLLRCCWMYSLSCWLSCYS